MARNSKNQEDGKIKKIAKRMLITQILVPIIIVVMIAGVFFAVINGILEVLKSVIDTIAKFFSDPIGFMAELLNSVGNWFASWTGGDYSAPPPGEAYMTVCINDEIVNQIKESITNISVDTESAGLTDSMLKAMILAYYSTYSTVDTFIYTQINDEEAEKFGIVPFYNMTDAMEEIDNGEFIYFRALGDKFQESNGKLCMATRGTVQPISYDSNGQPQKMTYYDTKTFLEIIETFEDAINNGKYDIESFFTEFNNIYTVADGAIGTISVIRGDTNGLGGGRHSEIRSLEYGGKISCYAMPIELLVNMLSITASPEFIEEVVKLVEGSQIEISINQFKTIETDWVDIKYTLIDHNDGDKDYRIEIPKEEYPGTTTSISADYSLSLKSVNSWYCKASCDIERIENPINVPEDITETYDFKGCVELLSPYIDTGYDKLEEDEEGIKSYDTTAESAIHITEGTSTNYSETTATYEENIQPFIDILKTKVTDVYIKDKETAIPGELLTNGAEMFFEMLEMTNPEYVNVMKYILYKYSGVDYGVTDFEQLMDLFNTSRLSSTASTNLVEYIFNFITQFEGTTAIDGDCYIAEDLNDGMITIGHGMTNAIPELNYIQEGTRVPIQEVDDLQKSLIRENIEWAKREMPNLKNYQIVGMVSFMYSGPGASEKMFKKYKECWNEERDNKFFNEITIDDIPNLQEQIKLIQSRSGNTDVSACEKNENILKQLKSYVDTPLYNDFWGGYCHGYYDNKWITYGGLLMRRWAEFLMFQYGYNFHDGTFYKFAGSLENWDGEVYVSAEYTFPVYKQSNDPRWSNKQYGAWPDKTIASSGCGCCSMAVILSGYTGQAITPDILTDTLNKIYPGKGYYDRNVGSNSRVWSDAVAKEFGCSARSSGSRSEAFEALKNGYCVVGCERGHVLAFVPVSNEDAAQGYVFRIIDSARGHNVLCRDFIDADSVVEGSAGIWAIIYPPGY